MKATPEKLKLLEEVGSIVSGTPLSKNDLDYLNRFDQHTRKAHDEYWNIIKQFQIFFGGKEYKVVDQWDNLRVDGTYRTCEICGFEVCRYVYKIAPVGALLIMPESEYKNTTHEQGALVIGDICVLNFTKDVDESTKSMVKRNRANVMKSWEKREYLVAGLKLKAWSNGHFTINPLPSMWKLAYRIMNSSITIKELNLVKYLTNDASWVSKPSKYNNSVVYFLSPQSHTEAIRYM